LNSLLPSTFAGTSSRSFSTSDFLISSRSFSSSSFLSSSRSFSSSSFLRFSRNFSTSFFLGSSVFVYVNLGQVGVSNFGFGFDSENMLFVI
jgi:hypothetical protein